MSRTYKHQHKYIIKELGIEYYYKCYFSRNNTCYVDELDFYILSKAYYYRYISPSLYVTDADKNNLIRNIEYLRNIWGEYISRNKRDYRTKLRRKERVKSKQEVIKEITLAFNDLEDAYYDYLAFGDPLRDMYGQLIDKTSEEYLFDVDSSWLEYLGLTGTLDDELNYCDNANANMLKEYKLLNELQVNCSKRFTEDEVKYYTESFKKAFDTEETDPIQRAINAYQAVKNYQEAWRKYGSSSRLELYTGVTNEEEAQQWLDEFSKNIE